MASINPSLHGDAAPITERDAREKPASGGARKRGAGVRKSAKRKQTRSKQRELREKDTLVAGWPEFNAIKPVLSFLAIPALLVLAITVTGGNWPSFILYPIALALGLVVALSAFKGVELVLAVLLIYLPFSKVFVVPIAPGVNGTNMLILLGLFAAVLRAVSTGQKLAGWPAGTYLVFAFGFLTSLSAFTITLIPGGRVFFLYNELLSYKAWVDQFIFYFIVLICVRDIETAKRCIVYVMIGSVLVVLYSVPEMLEKGGRSTIDKSRIGGPHLQSNNFGGFVAYTILPLIALFFMYIKDIKAWLLTPYFLLTAKVLITTFSRGAYVAMVVGGFLAGWYKGKGFLGWWAAVFLSVLLVFPSIIPEAIFVRLDASSQNTITASSSEDQLDKSAATRLVMWRAAAKMIEEDPIWGKGFKGFPLLKDDYIDIDVHESDPHSMYFYIGSQMGLPSLALFVVILGYSFSLGRYHSRNTQDRFIKVIGIGGAAATACFAVVCVFGSRAVTLNFTVYFWTFLVVMQLIKQRQLEELAEKRFKRRKIYAPGRVFEESVSNDYDSHVNRQSESSFERLTPDLSGTPGKGWQKRTGREARSSPRGAAAYQERLNKL